jgi:hypothetical protein
MGAGQNDFNISTGSNLLPNLWHGDKFSVWYSDWPAVKDFKEWNYLTNTIQNVIVPEYNLNLINSNFQGAIIRHPEAPDINRNLAQLLINYRLSEDMRNWFLHLEYLRQIRYGTLDNEPTEDLIRKYSIKNISINLLDNHKRLIGIVSFLQCFPTMISSLSLSFGESSECIFTVSYSYSEIIYKTQSIEG